MTKAEYTQQIRAMLSRKPETMKDRRTKRTIAHGVDAVADMVKEDLTPELLAAGFSTAEIEELFRPDRPMH
jgi:hypothetical protein